MSIIIRYSIEVIEASDGYYAEVTRRATGAVTTTSTTWTKTYGTPHQARIAAAAIAAAMEERDNVG